MGLNDGSVAGPVTMGNIRHLENTCTRMCVCVCVCVSAEVPMLMERYSDEEMKKCRDGEIECVNPDYD